jgi:hypothetical protein
MKRYITTAIVLISFSSILTSCLKDKQFENNEYGIKDPSSSPKGVSFPLGVNDINIFGLDAASPNSQTISSAIVVNSESGTLPSTDVHVKLALEQSLITQYNADNGTAIELFPSNLYSISSPTLDLIIPAGKFKGNLDIIVPSTVPLDLNKTYGLAFRIISVDNGYTIANNIKTLLLEINLKNKYDGFYTLKINMNGWAAFGISDGVTYTLNNPPYGLVTSAANKCTTIWNGSSPTDAQPGFTSAGGLTSFGATKPEFTFDLATDKVIAVTNLIPNDGRNRRFAINPLTDNRYQVVGANKIIYVSYIFSQDGRPNNLIYDTLTYKFSR